MNDHELLDKELEYFNELDNIENLNEINQPETNIAQRIKQFKANSQIIYENEIDEYASECVYSLDDTIFVSQLNDREVDEVEISRDMLLALIQAHEYQDENNQNNLSIDKSDNSCERLLKEIKRLNDQIAQLNNHAHAVVNATFLQIDSRLYSTIEQCDVCEEISQLSPEEQMTTSLQCKAHGGFTDE